MAHEPDRRPASAEKAGSLIAPFASRTRRVALGVVAVAALTTAGAFAMREDPTWERLGLPDAVAVADLEAAIRSYDVGDHPAAARQLARLRARAPRSAALAFWEATVDLDRGDEVARRQHCEGGDWAGSPEWIELAEGACGRSYTVAEPLRNLLTDRGSAIEDALLPIAAHHSLVPRLESPHATNAVLAGEARQVLEALREPPSWESESVTLPVRWDLARAEVHLALGQADAARQVISGLLDQYPEAPIVLSRAAWLHTQLGERERAKAWADAVADQDPRPSIRLMLDEGLLTTAGRRIDELSNSVYAQALVDTWCGYAYRFEVGGPPARCASMSPGLVRSLWDSTHAEADAAVMSPMEKAITDRQRALNFGQCTLGPETPSIVSHAAPPFETYLLQLDISAALCPHNPRQGDMARARRTADALVAIDPRNPWAILMQAQVDQTMGESILAHGKRVVVAEQWRDADPTPLVERLRDSIAADGDTPPSKRNP